MRVCMLGGVEQQRMRSVKRYMHIYVRAYLGHERAAVIVVGSH